jgi:hypothetical protein
VLSEVDLTVGVYVPAATPVKVALAWKLVPSIEYSTPAWVVNTIVPVEVAQVGCTVTLAAGVVGAPGAAFTVTAVPVAVQVLSEVDLTFGV